MELDRNSGTERTASSEDKSDGDKNDLQCWDDLLAERRRIHKKLAGRLQREPGDLLMNAADEARLVLEEKRLLELTRIPQHFDPYRGNPAFWKLPPGPPDPCGPNANLTHFYRQTKEQRNEIPEIEYVGVPSLILKEKDLMPRSRNVYKSWRNCKYRTDRAAELQDKIKYIEPHKPQLDDLVVIGKGIRGDEHTESKVEIEIEAQGAPSTNVPSGAEQPQQEPPPRLAIVINGVTVTDRTSRTSIPTITVAFSVDITAEKLATRDLTIQNTANTTVRLSWEKFQKHTMFKDVNLELRRVPHFFFDRNDVILVPDQKVVVPIIARITTPRSFAETWQIKTMPKLSYRDYHVLVKITCYGYIRGLEARAAAINSRIDAQARNNVVKEVMRDALNALKYTGRPAETLTYTEEQLFESINYDDDIVRRTNRYVYNRDVLDRLRELYERMRHDGWPETWNLCVSDLKRLAREADLKTYADCMEEKAEAAMLAREELKRQKLLIGVGKHPSGDNLSKKDGNRSRAKLRDSGIKSNTALKGQRVPEKQPSLKALKTKSKSHTAIQLESCHKKVGALLNGLRKPDMSPNLERMNYFQLFSVLSAFFYKIWDATDVLRWKILHRYTNFNFFVRRVRGEQPERLIYEFFDDTLLVQKNHKLPLTKNPTVEAPRPDYLIDIPDDDIEKLHEVYCKETGVGADKAATVRKVTAKAEKAEKKGAEKVEKKGADKETVKDVKSGSKRQHSTHSLKKLKHEPSEFNPFAEEFAATTRYDSPKDVEISSTPREESTASHAETNLYNYNVYVTFHAYLWEAVDVMLDVYDQFKSNISSLQVIRELIPDSSECGKVTPAEYNALMKRDLKYPPVEGHLGDDEGVKTHLIRGIVKPTKAETRETSLWSVLQTYIPVLETPPEVVPTPEESAIEEPTVNDVNLQASLSFESANVSDDVKHEVIREDSKDSTLQSSSMSFQYFYPDE